MGSQLICGNCKSPLGISSIPDAGGLLNSGRQLRCPSCGSGFIAEIFPALFRDPEAGLGRAVVAAEGQAACFYHPLKKAEVPCDSCGRFLCALCDVELNGGHLCPNCLQSGRKKGQLRNLENERVLYDQIALSLSLLPLIFWPATLVTAPIAFYMAIRHWNTAVSLAPRMCRLRFILAMLFSLPQIVGWLFLFGYLLKRVL